jgi:tetratricopeptide (TPR) repeat protein
VEELPIEKSPVGESLVEKLPVGDRIGQEEYEEYIEEVSQLTSEQAGVTVQEAENSITLDDEKVLEEIDHPASEQLDNLLDFAFLNKERHNEEVALLAFKQALALYPNGEAAPFLVVEVGNLLKNKGNYDEAIKVFSDGRSLCQSRADEMMEQEFISTIAYLRIIKNILLQHRLGCIKFLEIPQHILKEIDEEFREWRNVANI